MLDVYLYWRTKTADCVNIVQGMAKRGQREATDYSLSHMSILLPNSNYAC